MLGWSRLQSLSPTAVPWYLFWERKVALNSRDFEYCKKMTLLNMWVAVLPDVRLRMDRKSKARHLQQPFSHLLQHEAHDISFQPTTAGRMRTSGSYSFIYLQQKLVLASHESRTLNWRSLPTVPHSDHGSKCSPSICHLIELFTSIFYQEATDAVLNCCSIQGFHLEWSLLGQRPCIFLGSGLDRIGVLFHIGHLLVDLQEMAWVSKPLVVMKYYKNA